MVKDVLTPELTLADWAALDEDEPGELVDGVLVEEEMADLIHEAVVAWLIRVLGTWAAARGGFVFGSDAKYAVAARSGRKPDLTVYLGGGKVPPRRGVVRVPPDVAVEVISRSARDERRDRVEKLPDCAAFGIRFYGLVDPELRTLEVLELGGDGRYAHALGASEGQVAIPGCEGLTIDLDLLWAEVDRLGPEAPE